MPLVVDTLEGGGDVHVGSLAGKSTPAPTPSPQLRALKESVVEVLGRNGTLARIKV